MSAADVAAGLLEAADIVHAEARWQWELDGRGTTCAQVVAQRMTMVEQILRDRAAALAATVEP